MTLILASSSPYRLNLLKNEGFNPVIQKPQVDETEIKQKYKDQEPLFVAQTLARLKSEDVEKRLQGLDEYLIIGSDQICVFEGTILNKPITLEKNLEQLTKLQGKTHSLITAVCLISKKKDQTHSEQIVFFDKTDLHMKPLSKEDILEYLHKDQPFDCAGGYKFESLGHQLMAKVDTNDLTAIQGLPMKKLLEHL